MFKPNDKKNYLISGMFISILIFIVSITIFMLNKENPIFSSKVYIKTEVKSAQNLKEGAAVQLRGIKVGSVRSIQFKDVQTLTLTLGINSTYKEWVKKDATIAFKTQGVLGDKFLEILDGSNESSQVIEGDYLLTNEKNQFDQIISRGEDLTLVANTILNKFDKILSNIESNRVEKILTNVEKITLNTNKIMSSLNEQNISTNLSTSMTNLKQSSDSLNKITKQIQEGPGTLHALIYDQGLHEDLRSLVGGANRNKVLKYFIRESIKKAE